MVYGGRVRLSTSTFCTHEIILVTHPRNKVRLCHKDRRFLQTIYLFVSISITNDMLVGTFLLNLVSLNER